MDFDLVIKDDYFASLATRGKLLTNSHGITHPSQPNYVAMISGSYTGVNYDYDSDITRPSVVDLLTTHKKTWTGYMQGYPGTFSFDPLSSISRFINLVTRHSEMFRYSL